MESEAPPTEKTCFVIMPISDVDGYARGHFNRVYEFLIKPACTGAGFTPIRADEVHKTNHIIIDILRKIIEADMVLCDLSSKNPNVLYELGIRQAFNLPATIIKDTKTDRIFDIQGLRDLEYDETLRIDTVKVSIKKLGEIVKNTFAQGAADVNSIIQLLGVKAATIQSTEVSPEASLILDAISDISQRLSSVEYEVGIGNPAYMLQMNPPAWASARPLENSAIIGVSEHSTYSGMPVVHPMKGLGKILSVDNQRIASVSFAGDSIEQIPLVELQEFKQE